MKSLALAVCAGWLLLSAPAAAEGPDLEKAKRHYQAGEAAAAAGEFEKAAGEFTIAHEITADPVLFYKIARAHHQAGHCEAALRHYRRYLTEAAPERVEPFRDRTEKFIAACEEEIAERVAHPGPAGEGPAGSDGAPGPASSDPGTGETAPSLPPALFEEEGGPTWQKTAGWVSVGGVIAFGTLGAVLGMSARSRANDLENLIGFRDANGRPAAYTGNTRRRYETLVDEGRSLNRLALLSAAAAGACAVSAAVFFVLDGMSGEDGSGAAAFAPSVGPEGAVMNARWRF